MICLISRKYIIRCKEVIPEYLYLYLSSDTAKCVFNTYAYGIGFNRLSFQSISQFPVILPKKDSQQYVAEFEMITATNVRVYQKDAEERLKAYYDASGIILMQIRNSLKNTLMI